MRNTYAHNYMKLWWGRFHIILDGRNKWVVLGWTHPEKRPYVYRCWGCFNYIVSLRRVDRPDTDTWFRLYLSPRNWGWQ